MSGGNSHSAPSDTELITLEAFNASSAANVNGAGVNMSGWDGCEFTIALGLFTGAATFDARIVESANANFSGAVNVTGAALAQVNSANPNNVAIIDVYRPTNLYLRFAGVPGTNNVGFSVLARRYRGSGILPVTQSAIQQVKVVAN